MSRRGYAWPTAGVVVLAFISSGCAAKTCSFGALTGADKIEIRDRDTKVLGVITDPARVSKAIQFGRQHETGWREYWEGPLVPYAVVRFYRGEESLGGYAFGRDFLRPQVPGCYWESRAITNAERIWLHDLLGITVEHTGSHMPQVALRELADIPKDVDTQATVCVGLGEAVLSAERLQTLSAAAPGLSLKPYTRECLVPVTEFLSITWSKGNGAHASIVAQWSRKADISCFSDGMRRRVYEAAWGRDGWQVTSVKNQQAGWGTPKP